MQKVQARASAGDYNFPCVIRLTRARAAGISALFCGALAASSPAWANTASIALRARGAAEIYSLDRDRAVESFRQAIAADPQDAGAYRGLASALWLSITFRRGNMTVDDYLGSVSRSHPNTAPPPADVVAAFNDALEHALTLARARIALSPRDAGAHYELGAAIGVRASYTATVDNSVVSAFRAAKGAYQEHEKVLELDPGRKDAGLIVGTYRYIVSTFALPLRLAAYVVGFGGGKEKGLQMVEGAAVYRGDSQTDARFALILLYNREQRYDDALKLIASVANRVMPSVSSRSASAARPARRLVAPLSSHIRRFLGNRSRNVASSFSASSYRCSRL